MNKIAKISITIIAATSAAIAYAQTGQERRAAIESQYGVKNAIVRYDTKKEIQETLSKIGAEYYMYEFDDVKMTPAPKGYKPVYISHIGRHGARYAIGDHVYERLKELFTKAKANGKLTPAGEDLLHKYEKLYPQVAFRGGDLTKAGQEQLRRIASVMYHSFPEVFRGKTHAEILSTPIPRVMMSMVSFVDELRGLDRDFDFNVDASYAFYPIMEPNKTGSPVKVKVPLPEAVEKSKAEFKAARIDDESFCSRYFNDIDFIKTEYGTWNFETDLRNVIVDLQCFDNDMKDSFEGIFTFDELFNIWEVWNYNGYVYMGRTPLSDNRNCFNNATILKDMIERAERDLQSGKTQLNLKFSHDTAILPLVSFMKLNNFGAVINNPDEVKDFWRSFDIPMATNLQLIFYRSRRSPEILVKVLYNGREASLPFDEAFPSFYSWTDFKEYYGNLFKESGI